MAYFLENIISWFITTLLAFFAATISFFVFDGIIPFIGFLGAVLWMILYIPFKYRKSIKKMASEVNNGQRRNRDDGCDLGDVADVIEDIFD